MKSIFQYTCGLMLLVMAQFRSLANDNAVKEPKVIIVTPPALIIDTIPPALIKEVPKSRKQPVPIKIEVKPIPIIKPKIIKPVIKILR